MTPSLFDDRLREMEEAGASAASLNKLRAIVHAVFEQAIAASKWRGTNPISAVPTRKVPQRIYEKRCPSTRSGSSSMRPGRPGGI